MFAVGVNSSEKDFLEAFNRPAAIFAGYAGQFVLKPILGYLFGTIAMTIFGLSTPLGKHFDNYFQKIWSTKHKLTEVNISISCGDHADFMC
jgi:hypothetical protein